MKSKEAVPLKKVIQSSLGNKRAIKYLKGLSFVYSSSDDIYQSALASLLNSNTEKAIKAIIFGLDLDRDNNSILHLARTMLFSLSEDFYENEGDIYRQKYSDLLKAREKINEKINRQKKETDNIKSELDTLEKVYEQSK